MSLSAHDLEGRFPAVTGYLARREIEALAAALEKLELPAGSTLITEGMATDSLYFVASGELGVSIDVAGQGSPIGTIPHGGIVGEVALMDPGPASATVTCVSPATVYALRCAALDELAQREPKVATAILRALCRLLSDRIRDVNLRAAAVEDGPAVNGGGEGPGTSSNGLFDWLRARFGLSRS